MIKGPLPYLISKEVAFCYVLGLFCFGFPIQNPLVSGKRAVGAHGHDHSIKGDEGQSRPGKSGGKDGSQRHDYDGVNVG